MKTDVHIEHLVLHGLELSHRERQALGPAIARELRRLVDEPVNRPPDPRAEDRRRRGPGSAVEEIARRVAAAVHRATAAALPAAEAARGPVTPGGPR
jgi:hypothetical protein